jgi:glycosyltransferase involved in cell wall biosynthesis
MISILIPTYHYNVLPLVEKLQLQCEKAAIPFEIIVLDDASSDEATIAKNSNINSLENCRFQTLTKNVGRSRIRNLLAEKAHYDWLLFLDADTFPATDQFIQKYLEAFSKKTEVVFGGIQYPTTKPENCSLRHTYGSARESLPLHERQKNPYRSFITMGFAIKKKIFQQIKFNENLVGYGYEDSVFAGQLQKHAITIQHIANPVVHLNLESNADFIKKSQLALQNLLDFHQNAAIDSETVKILKTYSQLKKWRLLFAVRAFFKMFKNPLLQNLASANPSLFLFDLYRLGYLSTLKHNNA